MDETISTELRAHLAAVRAQARNRPRMTLRAGGKVFPVLRSWAGGVALAADAAPPLHGHVDIYEGDRQLGRALIVAAGEAGGEARYEFKYRTRAGDSAPPDYAP